MSTNLLSSDYSLSSLKTKLYHVYHTKFTTKEFYKYIMWAIHTTLY